MVTVVVGFLTFHRDKSRRFSPPLLPFPYLFFSPSLFLLPSLPQVPIEKESDEKETHSSTRYPREIQYSKRLTFGVPRRMNGWKMFYREVRLPPKFPYPLCTARWLRVSSHSAPPPRKWEILRRGVGAKKGKSKSIYWAKGSSVPPPFLPTTGWDLLNYPPLITLPRQEIEKFFSGGKTSTFRHLGIPQWKDCLTP